MANGITSDKNSRMATVGDEPGSGRELRQHRRILLAEDAAIFQLDEGFTVLGNCDISEGGVSFYSDRSFRIGRRMGLNIKNTLGVEIEVVHCEMEMMDSVFLEAKYRIGAKFVDGPIDPDLYAMVIQSLNE